MAKQVRKTHVVFGSQGVVNAPTEFSQFGSLAAGSPERSTDIATIMSLPAWTAGFQAAVYNSNKAILLNDLNSFAYEHSYQVGQILQDGVPQHDMGTTYWLGSVVQDAAGRGQLFQSLADNNTGNAPPNGASNANWLWLNPPGVVLSGTLAANAIPKMGAASATGPGGSKAVTDSLLSDDGVNVAIGGVAGVNGLKFPDGSVQQKAATSSVTNQNVVTGSRALNTVFQNTGAKPMFVSVSVSNVGLGGQGIGYNASAQTDSANPPTTTVQSCSFTGNSAYSASGSGFVLFIVLPGNFYKVSSNGTLTTWTEWS